MCSSAELKAVFLATEKAQELSKDVTDQLDIVELCAIDVQEVKLSSTTLTEGLKFSDYDYGAIILTPDLLPLLDSCKDLEAQIREFSKSVRFALLFDRVPREMLADAPTWLTDLQPFSMKEYGDHYKTVAMAIDSFWTASRKNSLNVDAISKDSLPRVPSFDPIVREDREVREVLERCPTVPGTDPDAAAAPAPAQISAEEQLAKKRAEYKCGDRFLTLADVPTWAQYAADNYRWLHKKGYIGYSSRAPSEQIKRLSEQVSLHQGDITALEIDVVVNAANSGLRGGAGVDGAIQSAAGSQMLKDCLKLGGCSTGSAKSTLGYRLPAKYVYHAVGPQGPNAERLASCYSTCLDMAVSDGLKSIAFPCISTGVYGYPNEAAAHIAISTVCDFLKSERGKQLERVIFCVFLECDADLYEEVLSHCFPPQKPAVTRTAREPVAGGVATAGATEADPQPMDAKTSGPAQPTDPKGSAETGDVAESAGPAQSGDAAPAKGSTAGAAAKATAAVGGGSEAMETDEAVNKSGPGDIMPVTSCEF